MEIPLKEIKLTNSTEVVALVDDEDYDRINQHKWLLSSKGYIIRYVGNTWNRSQIRMHNEVLNLPPNSGVDHIDQTKWNNCKYNLRIVAHSVNQQNRMIDKKNTTGFKGVSINNDGRHKPFKATIAKDGKNKTIGYFKTVKEAADAYDKYALELYGPEALTNAKIRGGGY
jgi:hypothetical protein